MFASVASSIDSVLLDDHYRSNLAVFDVILDSEGGEEF